MLSPNEKALLLALKRGKHFKARPASPAKLLSISGEEANPAGRHLVQLGLAARVSDSDRPGALLVRITDAGLSEAEKIEDAAKPPSIADRIKAIQFGKGVWEVIKLGAAAVAGAYANHYFGS